MAGGKSKANRRKRLFEESPNCRSCGVEMVFEQEKSGNQNFCTLFRTVGKTDTEGIPETILVCLKCATEKNRERETNKLGIEELRLRSSKQGMCECVSCGNRHLKSIKEAPLKETT